MNTHQSTRSRLKNNCVDGETHSFRRECRLMKMVLRTNRATQSALDSPH